MFDKLREYKIVPVVAVDSAEEGLRLCEALIAGGLPVAEITFRTGAAEATIREASRRFPEMILGAGTVLTRDQMLRAADAGAKFAVAPGCNPTTIAAAKEAGLPFAPGVCTPSDVERAVEEIIRLDRDDDAYFAKLAAPSFMHPVDWYEARLTDFLRHIVDQPLDAARRLNAYGYQTNSRHRADQARKFYIWTHPGKMLKRIRGKG